MRAVLISASCRWATWLASGGATASVIAASNLSVTKVPPSVNITYSHRFGPVRGGATSRGAVGAYRRRLRDCAFDDRSERLLGSVQRRCRSVRIGEDEDGVADSAGVGLVNEHDRRTGHTVRVQRRRLRGIGLVESADGIGLDQQAGVVGSRRGLRCCCAGGVRLRALRAVRRRQDTAVRHRGRGHEDG